MTVLEAWFGRFISPTNVKKYIWWKAFVSTFLCEHRHHAALSRGFRLSGTAPRLGLRHRPAGRLGCHGGCGHLALVAGGYGESSEVAAKRIGQSKNLFVQKNGLACQLFVQKNGLYSCFFVWKSVKKFILKDKKIRRKHA